MTKTTTKYGIYGVAAIAAILSISLIATAMNAQSAQAVPANKVGWLEDNTSVLAMWDKDQKDDSKNTNSVTLGPYTIHTSDKNNWMVTFWAECATVSEVQATGKKGNSDKTSGAQAGATAYLLHDGEVYGEPWRLCQEDLRIEADLNQLIEFEEGLNCDEEANPGCGSLKFKCDEFLDEAGTIPNPDFTTELCQQWVKIYLGLAGSYSAAWVMSNMEAGHHDLAIKIDMDATASGDTSDEELLDEPNGISSMVTIGNKIFVAQDIHIAQPDV